MAKQFSGAQFDDAHWSARNFPGGGRDTSGGCTGLYYANRSDIELIFGKSNVKKWADVDNDGILEDIEARICWALKQSQHEINNRLLGSNYKIPFVVPYPTQVINETARLAGVMLYDSRGITDFSENGKPQHQLSYHRQMVEHFINGVLARSIRLVGQQDVASTYPAVV